MDIVKITVKELKEKLENKEISSYDIYEAYMKNSEEYDKEINSYLYINKCADKDEYNSKYTIPIAIKDNIAVKGLPLTASSKMLEKYISPYNASVINNLAEYGIYPLGKVNMDEFAFGSYTQNSSLLKTSNPRDLKRVSGGSSGGSAAAVAGELAPWSLGSDTGGSIRLPAAYCGVVGFKPSYGLISRYGVISFASSFDQVGTITKTVEDTSILFNMIKVKDENDRDPNTVVLDKDYTKDLNKDIKGIKIAVVKDIVNKSSEIVKEKMNTAINTFKSLGAEIHEIDLPYLYESTVIYPILAYAEASSNLERFDGVRFGLRGEDRTYEEMVISSRTEGFSLETKKRIILGSYVLQKNNLEKYYIKAAKVRSKIIEELNNKFEKYDVLILPTAPDIAPLKEDITNIDTNIMDQCTIMPNLAGLPAISIPIDNTDDLPIGLQIWGKQFNDEKVLNIANIYEKNR